MGATIRIVWRGAHDPEAIDLGRTVQLEEKTFLRVRHGGQIKLPLDLDLGMSLKITLDWQALVHAPWEGGPWTKMSCIARLLPDFHIIAKVKSGQDQLHDKHCPLGLTAQVV